MCDALLAEISSAVNPIEVGSKKNRILRISFWFFSVAKKISSVQIMFISSN